MNQMTLWHTLIFGIVEGITEFLPVSSTGHLILTARVLNLEQTDFLKSFDISIQLGAILAVVVLYGKTLVLDRAVIKRVTAAFIPTAVLGLIFYKWVKVLLGSGTVVAVALLTGGIIIILFEMIYNKDQYHVSDLKNISYRQAVLIGLFQAMAMVPGVSRSAATIIGGLLLGLERKTIVEFSFLLAVPTMMAATGLDLIKSGYSFSLLELQHLAVGFGCSFIVAVLGIKFLLLFIKKNSFLVFGIYRIGIGVVFLVFY